MWTDTLAHLFSSESPKSDAFSFDISATAGAEGDEATAGTQVTGVIFDGKYATIATGSAVASGLGIDDDAHAADAGADTGFAVAGADFVYSSGLSVSVEGSGEGSFAYAFDSLNVVAVDHKMLDMAPSAITRESRSEIELTLSAPKVWSPKDHSDAFTANSFVDAKVASFRSDSAADTASFTDAGDGFAFSAGWAALDIA